MKGKSPKFSGLKSNTTMIFSIIALIIIIIAVVIIVHVKNNSNKESFDNKTYQFRTARAGHGMAVGILENSGIEKDVAQKQKINAVQCPKENNKKGFWVCNEVQYEDGRKRAGCGCLYGRKYDDPLNLFYDLDYKENGEDVDADNVDESAAKKPATTTTTSKTP